MWKWLCQVKFGLIWTPVNVKFWLFITKKSIIIPKLFAVLAFSHILPFVSSSTLWRSDDFVSSILKFEGWLSLNIRKTRLILPAETTKFLKLLAKRIMLNGRNYTSGMWTTKRGKLHLLQISLYQTVSIK